MSSIDSGPKASVILCSHNPRRDAFERTLQGLKTQTLPAADWELIVVDNASEPPLDRAQTVAWHPHGQLVSETQLGLTAARLRGFAVSRGDLLVLVDDDNVLDSSYLANALQIGRERPELGAWGAGQLIPEFESPPPDWSRPLWNRLAIGTVERDSWSNLYYDYESLPRGAGLCLRRAVADFYVQACATQPVRRGLDRAGNSLASCGDMDLALCACDVGMGVGRFRALELTHLIPPGRLDKAYLLRLVESDAESNVLLRKVRGHRLPAAASALRRALRNASLRWRLPALDYEVYRASEEGTLRGLSKANG